MRWRDAHNVGETLSLDDETGLAYGLEDPTLVLVGENVPVSTLYIRKSPAQTWQKVGTGDYDWIMLGASSPTTVPLFLPLVLDTGEQVNLPLLQLKLPFTLSSGAETMLSLGVA